MFGIGKPKQPRCFKNKIIPMQYFSQNKAWMTQETWCEIITDFDKEMIKQERKVILFVDNAAAHKKTNLKNVNIQYLPANTTSILQPLDLGIIHSFKAYYRQSLVRKQICFLEAGKTIDEFKKAMDILTALHIAKRTTIINCFKKGNFVLQSQDPSDEEESDDEMIGIFQSNPENEIHFENYIDLDNDLQCYALPDDDNILAEFQSTESSEDYDDDNQDDAELVETPSISTVLISLQNLQNFFLTKNILFEELNKVEEYMCKKCCNVQKKITDFFETDRTLKLS